MNGSNYPYTIDNGSGERLTFLGRVVTSTGERLEVENVVTPGAGPPMHIHLYQEEGMTVEAGRIAYQRPGEEPRFAEIGESVTFRAGEPHKFWNAGSTEARVTGYIAPPDNVEYLLTQLYASTKANGGRPDPFDAAFLMTRYRTEFTMVEIPTVVRALVLPLQVTLGRLLGKYRKFADAPDATKDRREHG